MLKLKSFNSSAFFLFLLLGMTIVSPFMVAAQDDMPVSDDEILIPPSGSNNTTPPVIIDESDSENVSDVEEYDG